MGPILTGIVSNVTGDKAADVISSVGNIIDNLSQSKDEKDAAKAEAAKEINRHFEETARIQNDRLQKYFADIDSARNMNSSIQESEKASWIAKNVAYILDLFIFIIWGAMTVYLIAMMLNFVKADKGADVSGVLGVYSGITAIAMTVLNFHRGTSRGSEIKQKQMDQMFRRSNPINKAN